MPKLKTYATYKNSGTDFIGNIPDEWAVVKLKYVATILSGYSFKSDDFIDDGIPIIRISDIKKEINWEKTKKVSSINEKILRRFIIQENDILIAMTGATIGKTAIYKSSKKALLNQRVGILRNNSNYDVGFLGYVIESYVFREAIRVLSYGGAQENVGTNDLENIYLPLASLTVQNCIVKFLDVKTSEIDTLIEDKEELIALLEEKRQATITEVVTKGLDPDVKMKDSDVEWIGEIPEHWLMSKIGYLYEVQLGKMIQPAKKLESDKLVPYLKAVNVQDEGLIYGIENKMYASSTDLATYNVEKGDLLICEGGEIGRSALVEKKHKVFIFQNSLHRIRSNSNNVQFLHYMMQAIRYSGYINVLVNRLTIAHLTREKLVNVRIAIPNKEEQDLIVKFLNRESNEITTLIAEEKELIQKLKEYRQSLIYEAVTGKIDVQEMLKETEQEEVSSS